jgi:hypothetical protein
MIRSWSADPNALSGVPAGSATGHATLAKVADIMFLSVILGRIRSSVKRWKAARELRSLNCRELSELGLTRGSYQDCAGGAAWKSLHQIVLESR